MLSCFSPAYLTFPLSIVDDSTGVIDVISLEDSARPESYNPPSPIEVGSLVRLTGALEETPYKGRRIVADKIGQCSNISEQLK